MKTGEPFVSPYLLQPLRSYEQALRDRAAYGSAWEQSHDSDGPARAETNAEASAAPGQKAVAAPGI